MTSRPSHALIPLAALLAAACGRVDHAVGELETRLTSPDPEDVATTVVVTEHYTIELAALATAFYLPWSIEILPDARVLVTEKNGKLFRLDPDSGRRVEIGGVPNTRVWGQGGLMDVVLHPDFARNGWLYLSLAAPVENDQVVTRVVRARLDDDRLVDREVIFSAEPPLESGAHFGSALVFDDAGFLYVTSGERSVRGPVQELGNHLGKVLRLTAAGEVPPDNPFAGVAGAMQEIFTLGHRNPQAILIEPGSREVWAIEHGPRGGDEVNRLVAGGNYGWPVVGYGREYDADRLVGEATSRAGIEEPIYYFDPSIGTAGAAFYAGAEFPEWQGDLLIGGLAASSIVRLELAAGQVVSREDIALPDRVRDIEIGPGGLIYVLTDGGYLYSVRRAGGA